MSLSSTLRRRQFPKLLSIHIPLITRIFSVFLINSETAGFSLLLLDCLWTPKIFQWDLGLFYHVSLNRCIHTISITLSLCSYVNSICHCQSEYTHYDSWKFLLEHLHCVISCAPNEIYVAFLTYNKHDGYILLG